MVDNVAAAFLEQYVECSHLRPEVVTALTELSPLQYDIVYVPGGVGAIYDFGLDGLSVSAFLAEAYDAGRVIGPSCPNFGTISFRRTTGER